MSIAADEERDPIELLAEQFLHEVREGGSATVEDYVQRYPEQADAIKSLFPTLLMMEVGKPRQASSSSNSLDGDPLLGLNVRRLGDFRIERCIGRGGMGAVYEATQESLSRRVALKVLSPSLFSTAEMVARFQREARAVATLHHSNIVPVYSVGEQWSVHYFAMQYIEGVSLHEILTDDAVKTNECVGVGIDASDDSHSASPRHGLRNDFRKIAEMGWQVASGLEHAHQNGTLHRDIKPANLLLDQAGSVWITDFGLAKLVDSDDGLTNTGQALGTTRYMPPEQFSGDVDHRGDIYSLGLTLYELITWQPAFRASNRSHLIREIANGEIEPPSEVNPHTPRDLETIVLKAISREPAGRYQTAQELADDLQRFCNDEPIHARRLRTHERVVRWSRRNPLLAILSGVASALLIAVAVVSSVGYWKTTAAYARVAEENSRATVALSLATSTLENIFDHFGSDDATNRDSFGPVLSPENAKLLQDLLGFYEQLANHSDSESMLLKAASAQSKVALIHQQLGHHAKAIGAYRQAIERYSEFDQDLEVQLHIARAQNQIGHISKLTGQQAQSDAEHDAVISLLTKLLRSHTSKSQASINQVRSETNQQSVDSNADLRFELARASYLKARDIRPGIGPNQLPSVSARRQEPGIHDVVKLVTDTRSESRPDFEVAVGVLRQLCEEHPEQPQYEHLLAVCLYEFAGDALDLRDEEDSEAEAEAIAILTLLISEHPNVLDYRYSLMEAHSQLDLRGSQLLSAKTLESIRVRLTEAVETAEDLVRKRPDVAIYSSSLAQVSCQLGGIYKDLANKDSINSRELMMEAERHYRRACVRQAALSKRYPTAKAYQVWLAKFQGNLARIEHQQRQVDQAHVLISRSLRTLEKLSAEYQSEPVVQQLMRRGYALLAQILDERGRRDRADLARALAKELGMDGPPRRGPGGRHPGDRADLFAPPPHRR